MENKQCKLCGSNSLYREGYNEQKKKAWKGYFCQNKDCGGVEWLKTRKVPLPDKKPNGRVNSGPSNDFNFQQFVADEITGLNEKLESIDRGLREIWTLMAKINNNMNAEKKTGVSPQNHNMENGTKFPSFLEDTDASVQQG